MVAGGKWWDLKVGFNIAHSQSLCMDSQQDFGENLPTKGHLMEYPMPTQNLPFIFSLLTHPLQTNLGIEDAAFFLLFFVFYMLSTAILNHEFYSPSTQIKFPNCILCHLLH